MFLVRMPDTGGTFVYDIEPTYRISKSTMETRKREQRAWRYFPMCGDGKSNLKQSMGYAAIAQTYPQAINMIKQIKVMK